MFQALQLAGAIGILIPFVALQLGRLRAASVGYLLPNLVGSLMLVVAALPGRNWGFILLEAVWSITSGWALAGLLRSRTAGARPEA